MLEIYQSNRVEELVNALIRVLETPLTSPFDPETIVVQSPGMGTWLSMELSKRFGVFANFEFPFPRKLLKTVMNETVFLETGSLIWPIMKHMKELLETPAFGEIKTYLANDSFGIKAFQLAQKTAQVFDDYLIYRPRMRAGGAKKGSWQAELWDRIFENKPGADQILEQLNPDKLPGRISLFGISILPPFFLEALYKLSESMEINLFLLTPTKNIQESINPLVMSLGAQARQFQDLLDGLCKNRRIHGRYGLEEQKDLTLLSRLQQGVFDSAPWVRGDGALRSDPNDVSFRVHACHNPMREAEVLHDLLLDLFDANEDIHPSDVIVMCPNIETYAPYIDAVFRGAENSPRNIPFRISDRSVRKTTPMVEAFLSLLDIVKSRLTLEEVFDLLLLEAIRERFDLTHEEVEKAREWMTRAGVRWGIDGNHRTRFQQPEREENTWRFGLNRLMLGYALPGEEQGLFCNVLPYDEIEGADTQILGRFALFCETLFEGILGLQTPRSLAQWEKDLVSLLKALTKQDGIYAYQFQLIKNQLTGIQEKAFDHGFEDDLSLEVMVTLLQGLFEEKGSASGFLSKGVCFCNLLPMRSIPFKVVVLMGMNDADFPRTAVRPGFDLMGKKTWTGDRSSREDDCYLFLEALLSARKRMIITYVGRSMKDNSEIPPCVVVNDLIDMICRSGEKPRERVLDELVIRHPLQPFSPRCFGKERLFSYSKEFYEGAISSLGPLKDLAPFTDSPLNDDAPKEILLQDLARFFKDPGKYFLERSLGLYPIDWEEAPKDREPIELSHLESYLVNQWILEQVKTGRPYKDVKELILAKGALPPAILGEVRCDWAFKMEVNPLVQTFKEKIKDQDSPKRMRFELDLAPDLRLLGEIPNVWDNGRIEITCAKLRPKRKLSLWIHHLAMNCLKPHKKSLLICRDGTCGFEPVKEPKAILKGLVALYLKGRNNPLCFFPDTSTVYFDKDQSLEAAQKQWRQEGASPSNEKLYRHRDPLGSSEFHDLAMRILQPIKEGESP